MNTGVDKGNKISKYLLTMVPFSKKKLCFMKQDSKDLNPKPLAIAPKTNSTNTPKTLNRYSIN